MLSSFRGQVLVQRNALKAFTSYGLRTLSATAAPQPATRTNRRPPGPGDNIDAGSRGGASGNSGKGGGGKDGGKGGRGGKGGPPRDRRPEPVDFSLLRGTIDAKGVPAPKTDMSHVEDLMLQADWVTAVRDSLMARKLAGYSEEMKKRKAVEIARASADKAAETQKLEEQKQLSAEEATQMAEQEQQDLQLFDGKIRNLLQDWDLGMVNEVRSKRKLFANAKILDENPVVKVRGSRKRSEAFATVTYPGTGQFIVNERRIGDWLTTEEVKEALAPMFLVNMQDKFDAKIRVRGGGTTGRYGAIRLAMARALVEYLPAWKLKLRPAGMMTRDSREVERKKHGQPKARKKFAWVKR